MIKGDDMGEDGKFICFVVMLYGGLTICSLGIGVDWYAGLGLGMALHALWLPKPS